MERGLLWLPLLLFFVGLAWVGWYEYQKVETYQRWSQAFDQAKYDIYAVLGQKGKLLTWGQPGRKHPRNLTTFSLDTVSQIELQVDHQGVNPENLPTKGKPSLIFQFSQDNSRIEIPFTDISLAKRWWQYLEKIRKEA